MTQTTTKAIQWFARRVARNRNFLRHSVVIEIFLKEIEKEAEKIRVEAEQKKEIFERLKNAANFCRMAGHSLCGGGSEKMKIKRKPIIKGEKMYYRLSEIGDQEFIAVEGDNKNPKLKTEYGYIDVRNGKKTINPPDDANYTILREEDVKKSVGVSKEGLREA